MVNFHSQIWEESKISDFGEQELSALFDEVEKLRNEGHHARVRQLVNTPEKREIFYLGLTCTAYSFRVGDLDFLNLPKISPKDLDDLVTLANSVRMGQWRWYHDGATVVHPPPWYGQWLDSDSGQRHWATVAATRCIEALQRISTKWVYFGIPLPL